MHISTEKRPISRYPLNISRGRLLPIVELSVVNKIVLYKGYRGRLILGAKDDIKKNKNQFFASSAQTVRFRGVVDAPP